MGWGDVQTEKTGNGRGPHRLIVAGALAILIFIGAAGWLLSPSKVLGSFDQASTAPALPVQVPASAQPVAAPVAPVAAKPELPPGISGDPMEAFAWDGKLQGMHIMSLCKDTRGRLWVSTEGNGAWCWDPTLALKQLQAEQAWAIERKRLGTPESAAPAKAKLYGWSQHTRVTTGGKPEGHGPVLTTGTSDVNSLGDDCIYAIACDKQGRIWTGHLNHGVSVYDGRQTPIKQPEKGYEGWRNYDVLSGPLGERVFDIGVNPVDGDVWIATDAGLSRYRVAADTWNYYTRADGLPADQVQALAFLKDGSVVAGTQCDGLGIAFPTPKAQPAGDKTTAAGDKAIPVGDKPVVSTLEYPSWRHVTTEDNSYDLPKTPIGVGLPSNLINDLLVARDGTLWVATTTGIAKSTDDGKTWIFIRGEDWEAKLRGLAEPPTNDEINIAKQLIPARPQALLLEDYTTSLSEDAAGNLWIGHWRRGLEIMNAKGERLYPDSKMTMTTSASAYIRVIEPDILGRAVIGCYGEGLAREPTTSWQNVETILAGPETVVQAELPKSVALPTTDEFNGFVKKLSEPIDLPQLGDRQIRCLSEDWMTQGDWMGRYGEKCAAFFGAGMPFTQSVGYGLPYFVSPQIGGKSLIRNDISRTWCWKLEDQKDRRIPFVPTVAVRRPSGWDDHGEIYSPNVDGPDLWLRVHLPPGTHSVSFYFMNYDGKDSNNRLRDHVLEWHAGTKESPVLLRDRVRDFYGGVYKTYAMNGNSVYYLHVRRNYSFNTMVLAAMFDRVKAPQDFSDKMRPAFLLDGEYGPPEVAALPLLADWKMPKQVSMQWRFYDSKTRAGLCRYTRLRSRLQDVYIHLLWRQGWWRQQERRDGNALMKIMKDQWK